MGPDTGMGPWLECARNAGPQRSQSSHHIVMHVRRRVLRFAYAAWYSRASPTTRSPALTGTSTAPACCATACWSASAKEGSVARSSAQWRPPCTPSRRSRCEMPAVVVSSSSEMRRRWLPGMTLRQPLRGDVATRYSIMNTCVEWGDTCSGQYMCAIETQPHNHRHGRIHAQRLQSTGVGTVSSSAGPPLTQQPQSLCQ